MMEEKERTSLQIWKETNIDHVTREGDSTDTMGTRGVLT